MQAGGKANGNGTGKGTGDGDLTSVSHGPVRGVILAAGQGKRMKSSLPKVLHDVFGKAVISRVVEAVAAAGTDIEHLHVVVGHASDQVEGFLKQNNPPTAYSCHLQEPQLGTGHALLQVAPALGDFKGTLIVTVGDAPVIQAESLKALLDHHHATRGVVTALTTELLDAKNYGRILRDYEGRVRGIVEDKDATSEQKLIKEINTGIYALAWPEAAEGLKGLSNNNKQNEYYLTDLVAWAYEHGHGAQALVLNDSRQVAGINSRLELAEAIRLLRDITIEKLSLQSGVTVVDPQSTWISPEVEIGAETIILPGCYLTGAIKIGRNCQIGPNVLMKGPVTVGDRTVIVSSHLANSKIGSDTRVGPFAHVRDGNEVGDFCKIGNFVELKKADIGQHTNVGHLSYIGDASLGSNVNIGAGTITANYDHITKKKDRTVIGDGASTGSNSVLVAPVEMGAESVLAAGTVVGKNVPPGALAVGRAVLKILDGWAGARKAKK
ncbi:MAG: bifunctional UDP-N-acetylglucosamine diphosphorylase/glucosamine-1-phosphate N-acetyltransferase GlmU [Cyanobacteria bacterium SZAS LIN-3]|nr:bifunctional UDP-N-acetylglucosamine diphosphorylase/glucosamine-1-phosphate N-acetyltransferase GlmU [Cyanobacteria bacterium SZAS LIN-3]